MTTSMASDAIQTVLGRRVGESASCNAARRLPRNSRLAASPTRRFFFALLTLTAAGCGDSSSSSGLRVPAASVSGQGAIVGRVYFDAPAPKLPPLKNTPCCPGAPAELPDERIVVNPNGTLANVFVYVTNGPLVDGSAMASPVLDQKMCQYVPHAIGVVVNQTLTLRSSDPCPHNVKIKPAAEAERNYMTKHAGATETTQFLRPGFATSACDVHPWMSAVIGVFDNPFFAVTSDDGSFKIDGLPDGTYTVVARHENYLALPAQTVTIQAGKPVSLDFRYTPPKP